MKMLLVLLVVLGLLAGCNDEPWCEMFPWEECEEDERGDPGAELPKPIACEIGEPGCGDQ